MLGPRRQYEIRLLAHRPPPDAATLHAAMEGILAAQVGRDGWLKRKGGEPYEDQDGEFLVRQGDTR
jgi:hypothetical protein